VLAVEVDRLEQLLKKRMVDRQTVAQLQARREALERTVELYPRMIESLEQDLEAAQARAESAEQWFEGMDDTSEPLLSDEIQKELDARSQRVGWLNLRREQYTLRASMDGMVSSVDHEPGEVAAAGEGVVSIVGREGQKIVGFLPETYAREVVVGMTVYLMRSSGGRGLVRARVTAIAPEILALPTTANPFPNRTLRGRRVVLVAEEDNDLLPGEGVEIRLDRPWLTTAWHYVRTRLASLLVRGE